MVDKILHETDDVCVNKEIVYNSNDTTDTPLTQETQPSLTNRTTHLCKCNGVADPKHAPSHVSPHRI